jgi:uncharacterized protein (DUF1810 family)
MTSAAANYDLERFVVAQASVYSEVVSELRAGRKRGHWMWFVFPQIAGLGWSPMAVRFALSSVDEARAYLAHPILGPRLIECVRLTRSIGRRSAEQIFGHVDSIKLRSSMTLFALAASNPDVFQGILDQYFSGQPDPLTIERVRTTLMRDPTNHEHQGQDPYNRGGA